MATGGARRVVGPRTVFCGMGTLHSIATAMATSVPEHGDGTRTLLLWWLEEGGQERETAHMATASCGDRQT